MFFSSSDWAVSAWGTTVLPKLELSASQSLSDLGILKEGSWMLLGVLGSLAM